MQKRIGKFDIKANNHELDITLHENPKEFVSKRKFMRYYSSKPEVIKEKYRQLQNTQQVKDFVVENFIVYPKYKDISKWNIDTSDIITPTPVNDGIWKKLFDKRSGSDIEMRMCSNNDKNCVQELKLLLHKNHPLVQDFIAQIYKEPDDTANAIKLQVAKEKGSVMVDHIDFDIALDPDLYGIRVFYRPNITKKDLFSFSEK